MYVIILAAGTASRMKKAKLLLQWKGESILSHMVKVAFEAELTPIIVTGCYKEEMDKEIQNIEKNVNKLLIKTHNKDYEKGQLSSLIIGVKKLINILDSSSKEEKELPFFITVGDLPLIESNHYEELLPFLKSHDALRPQVNGIFGHPVLLSSKIINEIANLQTEGKKKEGLRSFLQRKDTFTFHSESLCYITDIDTPETYKALIDRPSKL